MRQTNDKKETRLATNIVYKRLWKEKTETEQIMQHQYLNEAYINKHWLKIICARNRRWINRTAINILYYCDLFFNYLIDIQLYQTLVLLCLRIAGVTENLILWGNSISHVQFTVTVCILYIIVLLLRYKNIPLTYIVHVVQQMNSLDQKRYAGLFYYKFHSDKPTCKF